MGGGSYDRDVYSGRSSGGWDYKTDVVDSSFAKARCADDSVTDAKRILKCDNQNPIVIAMDVTGSMGIASKVIYDKMPMFFGQIKIQNYLPDPAVSFAAVGDTTCDRSPIQICDFETGEKLDEWLEKLYLEGGGGGGAKESYEMFAYYYLKNVELTHKNKNPFFFFIGDEGFYKDISPSNISKYFGTTNEKQNSEDVMKELLKAYNGNVFLAHKPYSWAAEDKNIVRQWTDALGQENILTLEDPKSVVDVMLGAVALVSESRDLDSFIADLKGLGADKDRTQSPKRISDVTKSLSDLNKHVKTTAIATTIFSTDMMKPKRKSKVSKKTRLK